MSTVLRAYSFHRCPKCGGKVTAQFMGFGDEFLLLMLFLAALIPAGVITFFIPWLGFAGAEGLASLLVYPVAFKYSDFKRKGCGSTCASQELVCKFPISLFQGQRKT